MSRITHNGALRKLYVDVYDSTAFAAAAILAHYVRQPDRPLPDAVMHYAIISLLLSLLVFRLTAFNKHLIRFFSVREFLHLAAAAALVVSFSSLAAFLLFRLDDVPRALPLFQWFLALLFSAGARLAYRLWHGSRTRPLPDGQREPLLIIGNTPETDIFIRIVDAIGHDRFQVVGILDEDRHLHGSRVRGCEIIGHPADLSAILLRMRVHGLQVRIVLLAVDQSGLSPATRQVLEKLAAADIVQVQDMRESLRTVLPAVPAGASSAPPAPRTEKCRLSPAVRAAIEQRVQSYGTVKRLLDVLAATVLIIATMPLWLTIAALIRLTMGRPVLFWQERFGRHGRFIRVYKFRTLHMPAANGTAGGSVSDSDRKTRLGTFLRRTRLDELPQLYNILKGDMSFVGPRPLLPVDLPLDMPQCVRLRSLLRPGLTGWAQINGGRQLSRSDKVVLDLWYLRHMSLSLDLYILLKTVQVALLGESRDPDIISRAYADLDLPPPPAPPPAAESQGRRS